MVKSHHAVQRAPWDTCRFISALVPEVGWCCQPCGARKGSASPSTAPTQELCPLSQTRAPAHPDDWLFWVPLPFCSSRHPSPWVPHPPLCLTSCECVHAHMCPNHCAWLSISLFTQTKQTSGEKLMDGSEILSLLESARKPTEFIGAVTSTSQSWVQVAVCFHAPCLCSAFLPFLYAFLMCVCVCVFYPGGFALNTWEGLHFHPSVPSPHIHHMSSVPLQEHTSDVQKVILLTHFNSI